MLLLPIYLLLYFDVYSLIVIVIKHRVMVLVLDVQQTAHGVIII